MARKRQPKERKLRTRQHVIADLSINHVERHILQRGFAVNRLATDYGYDLMMLTFSDEGEIESGHVLFQVKATDDLHVLKDGESLSLRVEVADLSAWQDEPMPVILVVYDGKNDNAFWLYVQQYLEEKNVSIDDLSEEQDRVTVRVPLKNRLDEKEIDKFRQFLHQLLEHGKGAPKHGS